MTEREAQLKAITIHLTISSVQECKARSGNFNNQGYQLFLSSIKHKIAAEKLLSKYYTIH